MAPTEQAPIPTLREALRYFWRLFLLARPYWAGIMRGLLFGIVIGLFGLVSPYLTKTFIDDVYPARDIALMHVLVVGVLTFSVASSAMGALRGYYSQVVSSRLSSAVSLMFFNHLQHLSIRFFDEHRVGEVMSRFGDMRSALGTLAGVLQTVLVSGTYIVIVPPLLLALNWRLALVALIAVPATTTISTASGRVMRKYWKRTAEVSAELGAFQVEVLSHIRTLKTMGAEHHVYRRAANQVEESLRLQLKAGGLGSLVGVLNGLVRTLGSAVFTWYAWTLILHGQLTLGGFIAFSAYLGYLTGPVGQFAGLLTGFQRTSVTLGRAFEYLDVEPEMDPALSFAPSAPIRHRISGAISITGVSFGYVDDRDVLHDVTVAIPRHSITAVVGPSGSGKSTLLRLLVRFEDPGAGQITIDDVPLAHFALPDLRRQVGVVWQEFSLLRGTLWENLTFGLGDVALDRVENAVRICRLDALIRDLPEGLETPVAEWGASLSGGQRQRMAIARALVRDTPILLLDEATSQIDAQTEEELLRDLFARLRDKTLVLVTHRVATAALADRIIVLEQGRLTAVGSHRELLASSDTYQHMVHAGSLTEGPRHLRVVAGEA